MKKQLIIMSLSIGLILVACNKTNTQTAENSQNEQFLTEQVSIDGKNKGEITKDALLNLRELSFDEKSASTYKITSFKMTLIIKGGDNREFESGSSGEFTSSMHEAIKEASAGSKVYFEFIKCADKNNITHKVLPADFVLI